MTGNLSLTDQASCSIDRLCELTPSLPLDIFAATIAHRCLAAALQTNTQLSFVLSPCHYPKPDHRETGKTDLSPTSENTLMFFTGGVDLIYIESSDIWQRPSLWTD